MIKDLAIIAVMALALAGALYLTQRHAKKSVKVQTCVLIKPQDRPALLWAATAKHKNKRFFTEIGLEIAPEPGVGPDAMMPLWDESIIYCFSE